MKDISGWYAYRGTTTLQHENIAIPLKKLFETVNPCQVLEIGTSYGGLTLLLRDLLDEVGLVNSDLRSYDVLETDRYWLKNAIENGAKIDFRVKNIFNHMYDQVVEEVELTDFIHRDGCTIILCDGGSKKNEFNILSKYLRSGDIIMAHDYSPNPEYFEQYIRNEVWNWHEIQDSDIKDTVDQYNLEPFMQEDFQQVVLSLIHI